MLENDIYTHRSVYADDEFSDAVNSIAKTLRIQTDNVNDIVLTIAAHTLFFSHEELISLFPENDTAYNNRVEKRTIKPLVKEKDYVRAMNLDKPIGMSKKVFLLTRDGDTEARRIKGGDLMVEYPKKRPSETVRTHNYCAGMNYFQMLQLKRPFEWERERAYPNDSARGQKKDLRVDGICHLYEEGRDRARIIYFEQDMGSEGSGTLLDKLDKYNQYGLMDHLDDIIVFSFFQTSASITANHNAVNPYSFTHADRLLSYMDENGLEDIEAVLDSDYTNREYVDALKKAVNGGDGPGIRTKKINRDFLQEFALSAKAHRNPYMQRGFNLKHVEMTLKRLNALHRPFLKYLYELPPFCTNILLGMQVLCLPTTLVAKRIPYAFLSKSHKERMELTRFLSGYFRDVRFIKERSDRIRVSDGRSFASDIALRNAFSLPGGGLVCVEFPFMDIGAYPRAALFKNNYKGSPISLICVFENKEQASQFYEGLDYIHDARTVTPEKSGIYCTFLDFDGLYTHVGGGTIVELDS